MDTRYHDCKYSERTKTVWKTLVDKWLEDNEREKEQKKRQKEAAAKAEVARKKRREKANLEIAYWQTHPFKGKCIIWEDL